MNIDEHFEWAPKQKRLFASSLLLGSYATQCRINWYISYTVFLVGARSMVGVFVLAAPTCMILIPSMKHRRLMPSLISPNNC